MLFPHLSCVRVDHVQLRGAAVRVEAHTDTAAAACPGCPPLRRRGRARGPARTGADRPARPARPVQAHLTTAGLALRADCIDAGAPVSWCAADAVYRRDPNCVDIAGNTTSATSSPSHARSRSRSGNDTQRVRPGT